MHADPFTALRVADPAAQLTPLTAEERDLRRTAVPTPAVAVAQPRRRARGRWFGAVAAGILVAGSAAVAAGYRPWERDANREAGPGANVTDAAGVFDREYREATAKLTLPPGSSWPKRSAPTDAIIMTGRGGAAEGMAVGFAFREWSCAAVSAAAKHDRAALVTATATLDRIVDRNMVDVPPGTPEDGAAPANIPGPIIKFAQGQEKQTVVFHRWIDAARAGDVANLRDNCVANAG